MRRLMILLVAVFLLTPSIVLAGIKYLPPSVWTPQEKWVWEQVSQGEIADFNKAEGYGGKLSPRKSEGWKENRVLRPKFLETILLQENYRNALTRRGVRIVGAWFKEPVDLSDTTIPSQLWLDGSRFELDVDLSCLKSPSLLSLEGSVFIRSLDLARAKVEIINMIGSTFNGTLDMNSMEVGGHLFMSDKAQFADVDLGSAKIKGQLDMSSSTFNGTLDMNSMEVGGNLVMSDKARFADVVLRSAKIEGQLDMGSSTFNGTLDMDSMEVEDDLFMRDKAQFADVVLVGAKIEDQLSMIGSTFKGTLNMDSMEVEGDLFMRNTVAEKPIPLIFARIQKNLDISGAVLSSLDLTGTKVVQEFRLGSGSHLPVKWKDNSELILRNTEVGNLQDVPESWPDTLKLQLDGFVYHRLGGFSGDETTDMATRKISWLKEWLGKQRSYSPRPYQQLAKVLRNAGYEDKATAILFEGKKRQQKETKTLSPNWWWLFLQWSFIGYGYDNFRVLYWVLILCGLGMLTLHLSGQDVAHRMKYYGLCYSLDMLLPIIELDKSHYNIELDGWVRVYFYVHKIFGYVLALFLIAGLSGLTKM
jgi:uncharacterized protein YjbI with pentapeptide repeats